MFTKISLLFAVFASTLYWLVLFIRFITFKETISYAKNHKPTIIISVKNGAVRLLRNLSVVLTQKCIEHVIVMNDYSTDATEDILSSLSDKHRQLSVFKPSRDTPGKKLAITEAIKKSNTSNLLFTDADCSPASAEWATIMTSKLSPSNELILGYGPLLKEKKFINKFARFETTVVCHSIFDLCFI